jgi:hypothetical protein
LTCMQRQCLQPCIQSCESDGVLIPEMRREGSLIRKPRFYAEF